jgi:putative ABC transport system permease protein
MGGWNAMLYHSDSSQLQAMQDEYIHLLKNDFITQDPKRHHNAMSSADTPLQKLARQIMSSRDFDSGAEQMVGIGLALAVGFMLLPSINLINLNISRIMERSSEIGVRKAFGASGGQLVWQFIVENLLLTFFGALIGLLLSWLVLWQIQTLELLPLIELSYSLNTIIYGLALVVVFALLSGGYPAYKMAGLHPVNALKGGA